MLQQLLIASALLTGTAFTAAFSWWGLQHGMRQFHGWIVGHPQKLRLVIVLIAAMLWTLVMVSSAIWVWATVLLWVEALPDLETAIYFTIVAFTTLGFGDVVAAQEWRILGALAAVNGLLLFGMLTAMLIETVRIAGVWQAEAE